MKNGGNYLITQYCPVLPFLGVLPSPGKPGFSNLGFPGRSILCQPKSLWGGATIEDSNQHAQLLTHTSWHLESLDLASIGIVLSRQQTTKVLISLRNAPVLFAYDINRFSHDVAHFSLDCAVILTATPGSVMLPVACLIADQGFKPQPCHKLPWRLIM